VSQVSTFPRKGWVNTLVGTRIFLVFSGAIRRVAIFDELGFHEHDPTLTFYKAVTNSFNTYHHSCSSTREQQQVAMAKSKNHTVSIHSNLSNHRIIIKREKHTETESKRQRLIGVPLSREPTQKYVLLNDIDFVFIHSRY
jgi:hypothetical protein